MKRVDWREFTRKQYYAYHWYKELRTLEQRRHMYQVAREAGCDVFQARRIRDVSPRHAQSLLLNAIIANKT